MNEQSKWDKFIFWLVMKLLGNRGLMYNIQLNINPQDGEVYLNGMHYSKSFNRHRNLVTNCEFFFGKHDTEPDKINNNEKEE